MVTYREDTTLSDKFVSDLLWFSPRTPASSTNKTDHADIHVAEKLLKVMLNTMILTLTLQYSISFRIMLYRVPGENHRPVASH
jgi:hypothetical protein